MVEAYLITWTTYGSWLPGDDRGYCTRKGKDAFRGRDQQRYRWARDHLKRKPVELSSSAIQTVAAELSRMFDDDDRLVLASVAPTHCHLIADVSYDGLRPLLKTLKGATSFALRAAGLRGRKWSRGYHAELLSDGGAVDGAMAYVRSHDDQQAMIVANNRKAF